MGSNLRLQPHSQNSRHSSVYRGWVRCAQCRALLAAVHIWSWQILGRLLTQGSGTARTGSQYTPPTERRSVQLPAVAGLELPLLLQLHAHLLAGSGMHLVQKNAGWSSH